MSDLEIQHRVSVGRAGASNTTTKTNICQCLVVSAVQAKRDMLSNSANRAGWDAVVCSDHENALEAFNKIRFYMAFVDLDNFGSTPPGFRDLCETLAVQKNLLLTICGSESDPQEEIWARQLGAWLYLPGVTLEHSEELAAICEQAQLVAGLSTSSL